MVDSVVMTHIGTAGVSVALINWLKNSSYFPWITQEKSRVMRAVALVTAAIGTIGIAYTWEPTGRVLSFTIPTFGAVLAGASAYIKSFVVQELTYQMTKRPNIADIAKAVISAINPQAGPVVGAVAVKQP
jgi:hypothetical protein